MTRSRATAKQAGTRFETAIVAFLRDNGFPHAERRARTGGKDQGDITGIPGLCIESKDHNRHDLAGWLDQANLEAGHANAAIGLAWAKRRGKGSPGDCYVVMDGHTLVKLLTEAGYR